MTTDLLEKIRIVLVETSHPGNIGGTARAMKNMGLTRLALVRPHHFPHADATARASGADDILRHAVVCDSLEDAIRDCTLVTGTSARLRSIPWPRLDARDSATRCMTEAPTGNVAVVFGREQSGLSNHELDRCHFLTQIASNPAFSSLNLAAAAQIMCYELRMASVDRHSTAPPEEEDDRPAASSETEGFYHHLEQTLVALEFLDPENPRHLMRRLRRLYIRARPTRREINILRGILTACSNRTKGKGPGIDENPA